MHAESCLESTTPYLEPLQSNHGCWEGSGTDRTWGPFQCRPYFIRLMPHSYQRRTSNSASTVQIADGVVRPHERSIIH